MDTKTASAVKSWGPLAGKDKRVLADAPFGEFARLVRTRFDPEWNLSKDWPDVAAALADKEEARAEGYFDEEDADWESGEPLSMAEIAATWVHEAEDRRDRALARWSPNGRWRAFRDLMNDGQTKG